MAWKDITPEQVKVYSGLWDIVWKGMFSIAALVAMFFITRHFLKATDWKLAGIAAALDAVLAGTTYFAFRHYFPNRDGKE